MIPDHPDVAAARRLIGKMPSGWLAALETCWSEYPSGNLSVTFERDPVHRRNCRAVEFEPKVARVIHRSSGNLDEGEVKA